MAAEHPQAGIDTTAVYLALGFGQQRSGQTRPALLTLVPAGASSASGVPRVQQY